MHDSCSCIAWLTVYACSISGILNYIPCTWIWLWYSSSLFRVSKVSIGVGKAPGYVTTQTESFCDNLNWIMHFSESHCLFTLSMHWQLASKAQNCMVAKKDTVHGTVTLYNPDAWTPLPTFIFPTSESFLTFIYPTREPQLSQRTISDTKLFRYVACRMNVS